MIDSIQRIKNYTVGWCGDNYYSVPASENTINDALLFINNLSNNMNCKPIISLATDGEICFVWKTKDYVLDLGFMEMERILIMVKIFIKRKSYVVIMF